jgi:hypothetical protein
MKETVKIKKWQLTRYTSAKEVVDLTDQSFVSVGKRAFWKRGRMEELRLPMGTSAIKTEAFRGCKRLKKLILSGDCNVGVASGAFQNCKRLASIDHFNSIVSIGKHAFSGCRSLREIELGDDVRTVGESAFRNCTSLEALSLPHSVQTVGKAAFRGCTELARVEIHSPAVGVEMFRGDISLCEIEFSPLITEIPRGCFAECSALSSIEIPSTVKKLNCGAFWDCARLETVELGLGVTSVGAFAFAKNSRLTRVVLPHSVKRLGFGVFGLGKNKEQKIEIAVDSEYMLKRIKRQLFLCGSAGRATVTFEGKTIEQRKRERRRSTLEQTPTHLINPEEKD